MALSDLAVFSEWVNLSSTEVLRQQIELFNAASQGTLQLNVRPITGDYSDAAYWAKISGLVRRRNPYGSGAVTAKNLSQLTETMVKIAAGTPPVNIPPGQFNWIKKNPQEGGAVIGQQLARDQLADMLNTTLLGIVAALSGVSAVVYDGTAGTATIASFNLAQAKFGDRYSDLSAWIMHSKVLFDIFGVAITNSNILFNYGNIAVRTDPFGRLFIVSDSPALTYTSSGTKYHMLGLVPGAARCDQNGDFTDNIQTINGDENILRTYQAEWSYNLGIKGFTWDKTNGGHAPNDAALAVASNWDRIATSEKDLAGVLANVV